MAADRALSARSCFSRHVRLASTSVGCFTSHETSCFSCTSGCHLLRSQSTSAWLTSTSRARSRMGHANNKTKRVFLPNLQHVTLMSEKLDRSFKFRVSTQGLRSVEHNGGLDNWLLKTRDEKLSARAPRPR